MTTGSLITNSQFTIHNIAGAKKEKEADKINSKSNINEKQIMMEVVDPFNFITTECLIPATQHDLFSATPFYRQDDYSPADDSWQATSDDEDGDGVPLPDDNIEEVTFCSVPSTPDNQDDVVPSHSDELEVNATIKLNDVVSAHSDELGGLCVEREESYVTPPLSVKKPRFSDRNDVVCEDSDELGFCAEGNATSILSDVVSGNSDGLDGLCVERESSVTPSPSAKKPRSFDQNDVVYDSLDKLGFSVERKKSRYCEGEISGMENTATDLNDVVCGDTDELGFSVERKRAREESSVTPPTTAKKLRFCDEAENTTSVANDVVCENSDGLGLRFCENSERIPNGVDTERTDDLGSRFSDDGDKIAAENTEEMVNDVVSEDFDELGFCNQERGTKDNSLTPPSYPPTDNTKGITNDVVSGNSADLGIQGERSTTNEEFVENTQIIQNDVVSGEFVDLGERNVTNEEFTMPSPSTTKELRSPELDGTEEVTVVDDTEGKEQDTEEVLNDNVFLDNTEEIDTSNDEGGEDDNGDGDTVELAEEEEFNDSTMDWDSKAETCGNHVNCLMEVMKMLAEKSGKEKEGGEVDFLETAKRRGYTFPKPRWMSS